MRCRLLVVGSPPGPDLRPEAADGGELAPLATRLAVGVGVASLGLPFAAGMWLYGRCYVASMEVDAASGRLLVCTVGFLGTREVAFDAACA